MSAIRRSTDAGLIKRSPRAQYLCIRRRGRGNPASSYMRIASSMVRVNWSQVLRRFWTTSNAEFEVVARPWWDVGLVARWLPRLRSVGPVLVGCEAGAAQSIGERATRRGLILAWRGGARGDTGTGARGPGAATVATAPCVPPA